MAVSAREPAPWWVAARPTRWAEALLVLAPLVFAGLLADAPSRQLALQSALAFGLLAAGGDAIGWLATRRSPGVAALAFTCVVAGLLIAWWTQQRAPPLASRGGAALGPLGWGVILLSLSVSDALVLRRWVPADVLATASGYVVRAAGGAAALQLAPSRWLVICSFLLGLFVGLGRNCWKPDPDPRRAGLRRPAVQRAAEVAAVLAVGSYVLYTLSPETEASIGSRDLLWTAPLVALLVARHREHIRLSFGRDPFALMLRDKLALGVLLLWFNAVLFVIHRPW